MKIFNVGVPSFNFFVKAENLDEAKKSALVHLTLTDDLTSRLDIYESDFLTSAQLEVNREEA